MPTWKSLLGRSGWEDEVIPYGAYIEDDVDLGGPKLIYESSQFTVVFYGMLQTYSILMLLLMILPLLILKVVVKLFT